MSAAKQGDKVRVHYVGRLDDGRTFDSSRDRDPLEFTLGEGQVIPGFEQAIEGMEPGEQKEVSIQSDQAYGAHREELVFSVPKEKMPDEMEPQVGQQLQLQTTDGQTAVATVTEVKDSDVVLDTNHPLAGKDLKFDLQLVEIV